MKNTLRKCIFQFLYLSKIPSLLRLTRQKKSITIIVFHDPTPDKLKEFILFLKDRYTFISLQQYINAKKNGSMDKLPLYPLVITLDDGHKNNYLLLSCIKKYKVPVTIFLCSGVVATNRGFWFNSVTYEQCQKIKKLSQKKRISTLATYGFSQVKAQKYREALSKVEIDKMKDFVDFQCHSIFHPILPNCDTKDAINEIVSSKTELEDKFDLHINSFAYPNGDYSNREMTLCQDAGYEMALSLDEGLNNLKTEPYNINRICIPDDADKAELSIKSSGIWSLLKSMKPT